MNDRKIYIGVDFGGTKILTGAISEKGELLCDPVKIPTNSFEVPEKIIERLVDSIGCVLEKININISGVSGIGLGVTGPLDIKNGIILQCPQLPTLYNFPLRKVIQEHYPVPVYMNNDANCLIYGETLFGSGIGKKNVAGFTLGTGLGCAIILDNKIFSGSTGSAGEIWTSTYYDGIIEDFVSGEGVAKIYKELSGYVNTPVEIEILAEKGNTNALKTWEVFGKHLSMAMSWTINVIDPEIIILGGSITNAYKFFSSALTEHLRYRICPAAFENLNIVCANLGANAGFIGAASLAISTN